MFCLHFENSHLVHKTLHILFEEGLIDEEIKEHHAHIKDKLSIKKSKDGVKYFIGSKINDVESSFHTYDHLTKKYPKEKFCYVAYFRTDRKDRTKHFIDFFKEIGKKKNVDRIFLCGHFIKQVHKKIGEISKKRTKLAEEHHVESIIKYCKENNLVLITSVNGVNKFMKKIEDILEGNGHKEPIS